MFILNLIFKLCFCQTSCFSLKKKCHYNKLRLHFTYFIQYCFICRPSAGSPVSEDAGIEPYRSVAELALTVNYRVCQSFL